MGSSSPGASSSHLRSSIRPFLTRFTDFPNLPPPRPSRRIYLFAHQWKWIDSFHTTELVVKKYDKRQVRFHDVVSRLNFPFRMALIHLVPPELGVVIARMAREDREAREHLKTEAADEAYMEDLCRQHPELMEAERSTFAVGSGEVIVISKDEVKGGEEDELDVEEWQSIYANYEDDDIGPSPTFTKGGMTRKGWLDVYYDSCVVLEVVDPGPRLGGGLGPGREECTQA
ncbi:hypothetical protein ZWY2020_004832 [Hordeum vulgare]|nr:hypothetical protein ZWY2020_004832 [Hordeum vulgare]